MIICPWFLRIAFFLGVNPYAQITFLTIHKVCGIMVILYVISIAVGVMYLVISSGFGSVALFTIIFRTAVTASFTTVGLLDSQATITFYKGILSEIDSPSRKKVYVMEDLWCLVLFFLMISEYSTTLNNKSYIVLIFIVVCTLNTLVPLTSMVQFSLCCASVQSSYRRLQNDLLQSVPRTSSFTLRRLRLHQLDIADRVRDISTVFGLRQLFFILLIQIVLLEKTDFLIYGVASKTWGGNCSETLAGFCGYIMNLWYFSYRPFLASRQHREVLATLMNIETKEMDVSAIQEMTLLAEDLNSQETKFSAAGSFYVGFHIFYSVIWITFSYIIIVGPMAYNKNRYLWLNDNQP